MQAGRFLQIPDETGDIHPVPDKSVVAGMIAARTDQTYAPTSAKAQSGIAVEQQISQQVHQVITPTTFYGVDDQGNQKSYTLAELAHLVSVQLWGQGANTGRSEEQDWDDVPTTNPTPAAE